MVEVGCTILSLHQNAAATAATGLCRLESVWGRRFLHLDVLMGGLFRSVVTTPGHATLQAEKA